MRWSTRAASVQAAPSPLTLTTRSSSPTRPISARPDQPVCSISEAVSPGAGLFSFNCTPAPAGWKTAASARSRQDPALRYRPDIDLSHEGGVAAIVSRRHARMTRDGQQFMIEDLGSAYETRINGQAVPIGTQVPIHPGQHLWLGGCTLAFDII